MKKRSPKSESTLKTEQDRPYWNILTLVKVNGQRPVQSQRLMKKRSPKLESTWKTEQDKPCWNILTLVKVNGQRPGQSQQFGQSQQLRLLTWQCDITLRLTWQDAIRSRRVEAHDSAVPSAWYACEILTAHGAHAREAGTSFSACEVVSSGSWLGFARDCQICQYVPWLWQFDQQNWRNPSVLGAVGVTVVTCFWQWLLDEGKGSERTLETFTGTKKSEEWLWYRVNNIKWKRKD